MPFMVLAFDYPPPAGPEHRKASREEHLKQGEKFYEQGKWLCAAGILNQVGELIGSIIICNFPSEEALRKEWLDNEPYLLNRVWEKVEIHPIRPAPFMKFE
ncbi:MAG: YciI family protein [Candidatus Saccharicenans sp.]|nr:YciI family protein [Candidatus Saccharicenans sp.]